VTLKLQIPESTVRNLTGQFLLLGLLKKPVERAGRNPFLQDQQGSQWPQEGIPDDA
jgi:hypothetical protein